jgi:hypothetical protein
MPSIFVFSKTKEKANASRYQRLIKRRVVLGSIENRDSTDLDDVSGHTELAASCDVGVQATTSVCDQCTSTDSRPKYVINRLSVLQAFPKEKNEWVCMYRINFGEHRPTK